MAKVVTFGEIMLRLAPNGYYLGHHEDRLQRIRDLAHVDAAINSHEQNVAQVIGGDRFDAVIDVVGSVDVIVEDAQFLEPGGLVGVYGVLKQKHSTMDLLALPNNVRLQVLNWPYHEHRTHDEVVDFVRSGKIDPKWFYSHVMPVEDAAKGVEMIRRREALKVIFTME